MITIACRRRSGPCRARRRSRCSGGSPGAARAGSSLCGSCPARRSLAHAIGDLGQASRVAATISGSARSAMIAPAVRKDCPVTLRRLRSGRGSEEALREDEQPEDREHHARRAGDDLDCRLNRARQLRRPPYSLSHAASATPIGAAIRVPTAVRISVPTIGSKNPRPCSGCSEGPALHEQARVQVGDPLDEHEHDYRQGDQAEGDAGRPAAHSRWRSISGQEEVLWRLGASREGPRVARQLFGDHQVRIP